MDEKETVRVAASGFELVKIDELVPYARNAKKHSKEQIKKIRASLREFGFVSPVLIDRQKNVLAGHGRIEAAKAEGMNEVPCVFADGLTEAQRRAYIIADNRLTELGEWDMEELTFEMEALDGVGFPVDVTGFSMEEIIGVEEEGIAEDDEFVPENAKELRVRAGEVWALGRHRLMCGSSASGEDIARLMDGEKADMVFTDPPYGVAIVDKNAALDKACGRSGRCKENIVGDTAGVEELHDMLLAAFENILGASKEDASYYVTSPQGGSLGLMMMMMKEAGLAVRHVLMWKKNCATFSMGRLNYEYQHEPIFFTWTKKHNWYGKGEFCTSVWEVKKPRKCDLHPTMKPIRLIANALKNSTKEGDIVLDGFGGSGSTLIACEQLGRVCRIMEIDPKYAQVIIDRWETLTGETAVRIA